MLTHPKVVVGQLRLTPIIEDFNDLSLGSSEKKVRDDFAVTVQSVLREAPDNQQMDPLTQQLLRMPLDVINVVRTDARHEDVAAIRNHYDSALGKYGQMDQKLSYRRNETRRQNFSITLISAITQDRVISNQLIEGGVDSTLFENFIYHTLHAVRTDAKLAKR